MNLFFFFILITLFIVCILLDRLFEKRIRISLFPLIFVSFVSNAVLGVNYISALNTTQDGIAINNQIAYWIIGEDGWTLSLFRNYFAVSLIISLFLLYVYFYHKRRLPR